MEGEIGIDARIAALAACQGGAVARRQLVALGLGVKAIESRVAAGKLHIVFRGVYAVGHPVLGILGRRWAAVLAGGPGARLSHAAAGAAHGFRRSAAARIDVTVIGTGRRAQSGLRLHRRKAIRPDEATTLDGLPITTPARTLLDLAAGGLRGRPLATAVDRAEQLGVLDFADLAVLLDRYAGRPGVPALRAVVGSYAGGDARSALEELIGDLCDEHGLPRPQQNVVVAGRERDFVWPRERLVVEADGYAWHRSPAALADDRERDAELTLAGFRTLRFTYAHASSRPAYVTGTILAALGSAFP